MKWERGHQSPDVIDARGRSGGMSAGGAVGMLRLGSLFGWKGVVAAVVLIAGMALCTGGQDLVNGPAGEQSGQVTDEQAQFVSYVLDDVQQTWDQLLPQQYRHAKLVLFRGSVPTACGTGQSATGPFYCPLDERVYIDLSFYDALASQLGAPGDFAQAYVLGHEIGHHVQQVMGLHGERSGGISAAQSVKIELQADCFAGVWANHAARRGLLEMGDPEEALRAAASIGDDTLQRRQGGAVRPETFTHGTSEQRVHWLRTGFETGDVDACETRVTSRR
jgi:predicted metalloprotease